MSSQLMTQTIQAPWGGMDTMSPDGQMPANKARQVVNMLPGKQGRVTLRGPARRPTSSDSAALSGSTVSTGFWALDDKMAHAATGSNPIGYMVTDWAPATPTLSAKVAPASLNVALSPSYTRGGSFIYGYTAGTQVAPGSSAYPYRRVPGGSAFPTDSHLLSWDGGSAAGSFTRFGDLTHPRGAADITTFLNRLWVLGGSVPGTATPVFTNRLYYSVDLGATGGSLTNTAADWQTGGITNQIQLEGADYGVALAFLNGRLIILRRQSIYMMTGTSPSNFQIRKIASVGCMDPGSVLEWDDGIFFLSDNGMMFFDGVSATVVSGAITETLLLGFNQGVQYGEASITRLDSDHFMLTTRLGPATSHLQRSTWICHVPSGSWVQFTSNAIASATATPSAVMRVANYPLMFDGTYFFDLSYVTQPELSDPDGEAGSDLGPGATRPGIPVVVETRIFRMGTPLGYANISRFVYEHILQSAPNVFTGGQFYWSVYLRGWGKDGQADNYAQSIAYNSTPAANTRRVKPMRRTDVIRTTAYREVFSAQVRFEITYGSLDTDRRPAYAELYDMTFEFQPTYELQ